MILNSKSKGKAKKLFYRAVDIGTDFKMSPKVAAKHLTTADGLKFLIPFPKRGKDMNEVMREFQNEVLPYCTNFSSPQFMGFPDSGNSVAAITGSILFNFLQQNLINQSFCGPSATFIEIAVLRWLREVVGYKNIPINDVWDVGGVITGGGTGSNTVGIMLARENKFPNAIEKGNLDPRECALIVPRGIGHYSVKSAQMWLGCGSNLIEVDTIDFRYDLKALEQVLRKNKNNVMCVVAYGGDSRTMTIDNFKAIYEIAKSINPKIWLHADACHGFSMGFSDKLRHKLSGIEKFDSITTDPHKVMMTPYVISALLVKDPEKMKTITSKSDLIMQEQFAFGQVTPFLGSRAWNSLKLWFVMKNLGKSGLGKIIERRHELAQYLEKKLRKDKDFKVLNKVQINSVAFMYTKDIPRDSLEKLNQVNKKIHDTLLMRGDFHLHQFSVPDSGIFQKDFVLYPLRFMSGNPNLTEKDIDKMVEYVRKMGSAFVAS